MSAPQVYLIDSKSESRTELAFSLQGGGLQVHAFPSMPAFLQWLDYDAMPNNTCVVSELDMAEMNGRELCNVFDADEVDVPMVFMHDDQPSAEDAAWLAQQSIPLICQPFKFQELLETVQTALDKRLTDRGVADELSQRDIQQRIAALSPREMQVLAYVFDGLLNKLIADRLDISIKTVEMHRAHMMKKMQAHSTIDLVKMIAFNGGVPLLHRMS